MSAIKNMLTFISELKCNNDREWFADNKERYQSIRLACLNEINILIQKICKFDKGLMGLSAEDCIYRIYRDIRFSQNKQPFKTHFGVVLGPKGKKTKNAAYYIHIEPGRCAVFSGLWFPENDILKALRNDIDAGMEEFLEILNEPKFKKYYPSLVGDSLKTLPKGFPKDYPHPGIIKMKEFLISKSLDDDFFNSENWTSNIIKYLETAKPFNDFLNYTFEEMHSTY